MSEKSHAADWKDAPVIESASATTSPENSDSGPAAYVILGIVVALLALLSFSLSSCSSALSAATTVGVTDGWGMQEYHDWDYDDYTEEQDPYYELLEDLLSEQTTYA